MKFKLHLPATFLVDYFESSYFFSALQFPEAFLSERTGICLFFARVIFHCFRHKSFKVSNP